MARTGVNENKQANQQLMSDQNAAFVRGQKAVGNFSQGEATLERGGNVGANPYLSPTYLASVNRLQAGALDSENNAAKNNLQMLQRRTGGMNSTATAGGIADAALQKERLASELSAGRTAADYNRNLDWQQYLLQNRLAPAGAEGGYFSTATSGRSASLKNLTDLGIAAYGPWMAAIQAAGQAASAGLSGGAGGGKGGCWIAEAIYGENDARTHLLRSWLNTEFTEHWYGRAVMRVYLKFGERVAAKVRQWPLLKAALKPLFELALASAVRDRSLPADFAMQGEN